MRFLYFPNWPFFPYFPISVFSYLRPPTKEGPPAGFDPIRVLIRRLQGVVVGKKRAGSLGTLPEVLRSSGRGLALRFKEALSPHPDQADDAGGKEQRGAGDRGHDGRCGDVEKPAECAAAEAPR
jgi:hypothetical protein